jgi:hypothetical protein
MSSINIPKSRRCGQEHLSFLPETSRILYTSIRKSIEMLEDSITMIMIMMTRTRSPELSLIEHFYDASDQPEQQQQKYQS